MIISPQKYESVKYYKEDFDQPLDNNFDQKEVFDERNLFFPGRFNSFGVLIFGKIKAEPVILLFHDFFV
jgi:hypothetical protein